MSFFAGLSKQIYFGNPLLAWAEALAAVLVVTVGLHIFRAMILLRLKNMAARHHLAWPEHGLSALDETKSFLLFVVGLGAGSAFLELPQHMDRLLDGAAVVAFFMQCGIWLSAFYMAWYRSYREKYLTQNASVVTTLDATRILVRLVIWLCVLLVALSNLGFNISGLITGLGVGGVAIALAVQKILGDVLASLAIVTDKPFVMGDFIDINNNYMGSVEYIGLNTTRLHSLTGEQIIVSNSDLLSSRIRNYGRMSERRIDTVIGVTYQTPQDKLAAIPRMIKDIIAAQNKTRLDRAHFRGFGAYTLDFEFVYYVLSPDYNTYMDIQQAINLALAQRFEAEGIEFAFPTQTLFIQKESEAAHDRKDA